jgi:hypothetical protein
MQLEIHCVVEQAQDLDLMNCRAYPKQYEVPALTTTSSHVQCAKPLTDLATFPCKPQYRLPRSNEQNYCAYPAPFLGSFH